LPIDRPTHHLAQVNIARVLAPVDSPMIADFMALLEPINAIADKSPGFVWRLQTDAGDATSIHVFDDDRILINMSVWRSLEELRDFTYRSSHVDVLRRRREWFEHMTEAYLALWWLPTDRLPTPEEAKWRVDLVRHNGPTADAFTFRSPFGPPELSRKRPPAVGAEFCFTA
jgi:hypothetical protein